MQQPPQQRGAALPPQGFVGAGMPSPQGIGSLASAAAQAQEQAIAEEAARTRAAEQMAFEDAWKALNPDFRTPFASVEDAVSRLLPYHVFADYEEEDDAIDATSGGNSSVTEISSAQKWEDDMGARVEVLVEHFEKQVLSFNLMAQHRAAGLTRTEERLLLERALHDDERRQSERLHAIIAQHQQREHQEAAARARQALAQAQAQAAGAWPAAVQPAALWQALAAAAVRGEGGSHGQAALAPAPAVAMQQQQQETLMTAGAWQALAAAATASRGEGGSSGQALVQAVMMQHMQRQRQQQQEEMMAAASRGDGGAPGVHAAMMQFMQQQNQQRQHEEMMAAVASRGEVAPSDLALAPPATLLRQLQLQQQQLDQVVAAGGWQMGGRQMYAATRGDGGSTSSQAAFAHALLQQPPGPVQEQGQASSAAAGMALLPWRGSAERREQ
ncbi:hypothetical protein U9M48_032308 [Paspalum notatum var. saurae]|uniref:GLTSCR protein conserved domain-containing protein n=1 Tax=Paspalum notatum var. saurae TaxID=547442 RepID=A0AAQ3X599_PASNO